MTELNKVLLNAVVLTNDDWDLYRIAADQFEESGHLDSALALRFLADHQISLLAHLVQGFLELKIRQVAPIEITLSNERCSTTFTFNE